MKKGIERFDNKKVLLIGGNESIGVPCAVYNKNRIGFMEIVANHLISEGIDLDVINMFSMFINKNWHIDEILKHNLTLEEIKNMKKASIMVNRKDFFNKIVLPKDLENLDEPLEGDQSKRVSDMIKSYEKVITFYQSGSNNLMYEMQASPITSVLNKDMRNRALDLMSNNQIIKKVISGMDRNINNFLSINNSMELYVLSLYVPKLFSKLSKHSDEFKIMSDFIERFNDAVESMALSNMVKYVDITSVGDYCAKFGMDFHCTQEGHEHLANLTLKSIMDGADNVIHIPNKNLKLDNQGLSGMIIDAKKRLSVYESARQNNDYDNTILCNFNDADKKDLCEFLINEHKNETEVFEIAKRFTIK